MKRVVVRHKREDDERVRKRGEVHQDSVYVNVIDDDCQMCQGRCCQKEVQIKQVVLQGDGFAENARRTTSHILRHSRLQYGPFTSVEKLEPMKIK